MESISHLLTKWRKENLLLFVTVVLPRKGRYSFYGRIISYDEEMETILFYYEDKASTELVSIHDVDNIEPAKSRI